MIYADYNATTPCDERVAEALLPYFTREFGNPSSIYQLARTAGKAVTAARESVALLLGCFPDEVFFTSGGSESDNWAIKGVAAALRKKGNHLITSKIEHHAVLNACKYLEKQGYEVSYLPVDSRGLVVPEVLSAAIRETTILVTVMHANNEIGTIEPIRELAEIARSRNVLFHTDAVQTVGKIPVSVKDLGVDLLSFSGHKLYGPKGIGGLFIRKGVSLPPLIHGGEQEKGRRAGTENVPGIVGLGAAARFAMDEMGDEAVRVGRLRDRLEAGVRERIPEIIVNGHPEQRLFNTLNFCVRYIEGEGMLLHLDFEGICASSGSACTSGSLEPSHVLLAVGLPHETAHGSLRFSLGKYSTDEDVEKILTVLPPIVERLRKMSPFWNQKA